MKRSKFIATAATLIATPLLGRSQAQLSERTKKGFKVEAGESRTHVHLKLKGVNSNVLDVKISGSDTDGDIAVFEQTSLSPGRGTPLHVHYIQDEIFYVIEGSYYFQVGDEYFNLTVGESIFLPRKVAHAWTQVSEKGRLIVTFQPAGKMEDFFVSMSSLDHEPSLEEIKKIFNDNLMDIVGPPLKLKQ